jgi:hypothetical protein
MKKLLNFPEQKGPPGLTKNFQEPFFPGGAFALFAGHASSYWGESQGLHQDAVKKAFCSGAIYCPFKRA